MRSNAWFLANYIGSRAALTHSIASQPIVLEEAGVQDDWANRDQVNILCGSRLYSCLPD